MPKVLEEKLKQLAEKHNLSGKRKDAYVYGTLHKIKEAQQKKHLPKKGK